MTNKHLFSRLKNPVILSNLSSCLRALRALRGEKICAICGNSWSINDLRAYKSLYRCKETFTDVMSALQIRPFMQNKANFRKSQMNVSTILTKDYENNSNWTLGQNEPKTNPIRTQTNPIKANLPDAQNERK